MAEARGDCRQESWETVPGLQSRPYCRQASESPYPYRPNTLKVQVTSTLLDRPKIRLVYALGYVDGMDCSVASLFNLLRSTKSRSLQNMKIVAKGGQHTTKLIRQDCAFSNKTRQDRHQIS
eukprot:3673424-Amphidinium_carterae.1